MYISDLPIHLVCTHLTTLKTIYLDLAKHHQTPYIFNYFQFI